MNEWSPAKSCACFSAYGPVSHSGWGPVQVRWGIDDLAAAMARPLTKLSDGHAYTMPRAEQLVATLDEGVTAAMYPLPGGRVLIAASDRPPFIIHPDGQVETIPDDVEPMAHMLDS